MNDSREVLSRGSEKFPSAWPRLSVHSVAVSWAHSLLPPERPCRRTGQSTLRPMLTPSRRVGILTRILCHSPRRQPCPSPAAGGSCLLSAPRFPALGQGTPASRCLIPPSLTGLCPQDSRCLQSCHQRSRLCDLPVTVPVLLCDPQNYPVPCRETPRARLCGRV